MFVHSKDERQRTPKLERIRKRAIEKPDTVFNNLGHVLDLDLLRECYRQLGGKKAVGADKVTKRQYGERLEENLQILLKKIRQRSYKPQAARIVEIPKEDGSTRPLAISCFEDKLVQQAASWILTDIFEPLFLPCSYGYREGINGHQALRDLMKHSNRNQNGMTVEIDLQKYFNTIPHGQLMNWIKKKIEDKGFLKLIEVLLRSPTLKDGKAVLNDLGSPQGSIISPILSNIYLHYVLDEWFNTIKSRHFRGRAELVRFADDAVLVFQYPDDAKRFYTVLPKRLEKYGLKLHEGKSGLLRSGSKAAEQMEKMGKRLPTYKFLGFTCYWGRSLKGFYRLKYKSRSDRMTAKLKGLRQYLKTQLATDTVMVIKQVGRVVRGWLNYHGISDNQKRADSFNILCKRILFNWVNRKGCKYPMNWPTFVKLLKRGNYPERYKTISMFTRS